MEKIIACVISILILGSCTATDAGGKPSYREFRYEMNIAEANQTYTGVEICKLRHRHLQDTYSKDTDQWKETLGKIDALILVKFKWPTNMFDKVRTGQLLKGMSPVQAYCSVGFPESVRKGLRRGPEWSQATLRAGSYLFFENDQLRYWDL
jgi:hypothetical protein